MLRYISLHIITIIHSRNILNNSNANITEGFTFITRLLQLTICIYLKFGLLQSVERGE